MYKLKIGFVGFGEVNSPRELIVSKCREAESQLKEAGLELVRTEPVSDDPEGRDARRAVAELSGKDFDLLVVCIAGWIPTYAVINVISAFYHKPMVLWGLAGYYENGRLVTTADQAGTTALRIVMEDMGYNFKYVYNTPDGGSKVDKVISFARAATASRLLKSAKIGSMGYRDMKLYGTQFDSISLRGKIGVEVEIFDMLEMVQKADNVKDDEISRIVDKVKNEWQFEKTAKDETLKKGAKYYLALKEIIKERGYEAVSLIDVDGMKKLLHFPPSMIFMLIANELDICTTPENDISGCVTQLITRYLTGQIGAYMEFYEFFEDRVLIGVPDYIPGEVTDGPVKVNPTAFGGFAEGILNVSRAKTGRVTLCRLIAKGGKYIMHVVSGEAVTPHSWEEAGWTHPAPQLPGLEIILDTPVEAFTEKVASQHYIISYGDNRALFKDFCKLAGIEMT